MLEELTMSWITDRKTWPPGRFVSRSTTSRAELVFWIALVAVAAAAVASAFVGVTYGFQVPSETFLVGP